MFLFVGRESDITPQIERFGVETSCRCKSSIGHKDHRKVVYWRVYSQRIQYGMTSFESKNKCKIIKEMLENVFFCITVPLLFLSIKYNLVFLGMSTITWSVTVIFVICWKKSDIVCTSYKMELSKYNINMDWLCIEYEKNEWNEGKIMTRKRERKTHHCHTVDTECAVNDFMSHSHTHWGNCWVSPYGRWQRELGWVY